MKLAELKDENLLFYDIEVFKFNSFVVFKNINKEVVAVYHNDFEGITDTIRDKILVGYNNLFYDSHILDAMTKQHTPLQIKKLNDDIISGRKMKYTYNFKSLDCFQQIDVSSPSLKKIEGNLGKMILESSVDFTLDRALSPKEYEEALEYCKYDVDMTIEVFKKRINSYFKPKLSLVERLGNEKALNWNTTTLSANLLTPKPLPKWSSIRLHKDALEHRDEGNMKMFSYVPEQVREHWLSKIEHNYSGDYKGNISIENFGCEIEFGFGGLHGVHKTLSDVKDVKLLDVASMYPHIILNINALESASETYKSMLEERIEIKHKDKTLSDALKLVLNSVYGNLKNKYSILFDPLKAVSVCLYGQIALYNLCERLSETCTIININTDGVAFTTNSEAYKQVWEDWQKDFNLTLEEEKFDRLIQKDVNNYIAVDDEEIKVKGGDVSRYHFDSDFRNNNARIIDIAIVEYILNGTDILTTLHKHLDNPKLYQYVLQAGSTYKGTFDEAGNQYQKINRVFATHEDNAGNTICLFKKRQDDGLVRFADAPTKMYLWNDETDKVEDFENIIDLTHYYQIITKKLKGWGVTL